MRRLKRWENLAQTAKILAPFLVGVLCFSLCFSGCERRAQRRREREAAAQAAADSRAATQASRAAANGERPPVILGLTAETALRDMVAAYSNAKFYSDFAYFEIVCERDRNRRERFIVRVPCSIAFAKPNFIRMEVGSGLLCSDGTTMRAEIFDEARSGQYFETPAPMMLTSIKELYPDAQLADAMDLGVPANIFWVPPQLILLLAKEPLKTLIPPGAQARLLPPEYLRFENPETKELIATPCDRVQIVAEDGTRVLWIDRRTKALARCELPVERLAVPENVDRVAELRLEFPNQILSDSPPETEEATLFQLAPLDENAADAKNGSESNGAPRRKPRRVERFLPPELLALGQKTSAIRLRSLVSGFSDLTLGTSKNEKKTLVCFWGSPTSDDPNLGERCEMFLKELERTAQYNANDARVQFLAVNFDSAEISDDDVRAQYGALGSTTPLYRVDRESFDSVDFPPPTLPSIALIDERGVVQKFYRTPVSFVGLQRQIVRSFEGRDLFVDDFNAYYSNVKKFADYVEAADANDRYFIASEARELEPTTIPPRQYPKTFGLREIWKFDDLYAPSNPLAVAAIDRDFNAFRASENDEEAPENAKKTTGNAAENRSENAKKTTGNAAENRSENVVPLASAGRLPEDLLVVPCDGNALALLAPNGRLIRKITPAAAVGEPISFVRTVRYDGGKRYYVASAQAQSRKIHRFDENFNDLGTLDVGRQLGQWVGDARFVDADADGTPELALGLVGDPTSNSSPTSGLYAVEMQTPKIRWKDELIVDPYRLGVRTRPNETPPQRLLATNRSEGVVGTIVEDAPADGTRLDERRAVDGGSFLWFAVSDATASGESNVVALLAQPDPVATFFVGLGADGSILWKNPIDPIESGQMESVVSGDLDGDGVDEWLVASVNGVVRFFAADGKPLDVFHFGEEISGVCVARWNGASYLIIADAKKISAWKIEKRR